jgi:hypothetical protein
VPARLSGKGTFERVTLQEAKKVKCREVDFAINTKFSRGFNGYDRNFDINIGTVILE